MPLSPVGAHRVPLYDLYYNFRWDVKVRTVFEVGHVNLFIAEKETSP